MFHGHHGASARTPCMYRSMASCVAGSSQDSGSRTVRLGTTSSSDGGQLGVEIAPSRSVTSAIDSTRGIELHLQGADAGREFGDARDALRAARCSSSTCTRARKARSSTIGPYSTSTSPSPSRRSVTSVPSAR